MSDVNIRMTVEDAEAAAAWARFNAQMQIAGNRMKEIQSGGTAAAQSLNQGFGTVHHGFTKIIGTSAGLVTNLKQVGHSGQAAFTGTAAAAQQANQQLAFTRVALGGVGQGMLALTGFGSGAAAFYSITRLIRAEWDAIVERQKEASGKQVDVNASWRAAVLQLQGRKTSITPDSLFESMVGGANGVQPAEMFQTFAEVAGAAGDIPVETVRDTILESARLYPGWDVQTRSAAVRGSVLTGRAFGTKPRETFAGIVQAMTQDPSMTPQQFSEFVLPSLISLRAIGSGKDSFEDLAALQFAYNQRAGDVGGRSGGTNLINLVRQIHRDAVGAKLVPRDASVMQLVEAAKASPPLQSKLLGSFAQESLGADERAELRAYEAGLKNRRELTTRARFFIASREVLSPSEGNELDRIRTGIRPDILGLTPAASVEAERLDKQLRGSRFAAAAEIERVNRQRQSEADLLNTRLGTTGASRKLIDYELKRMGYNPIIRRLAGIQLQVQDILGYGPRDEAGSVEQANRILRTQGRAGPGLAPAMNDPAARAQQRMVAEDDRLGEVISILREIRDNPTNVNVEKLPPNAGAGGKARPRQWIQDDNDQ